MSQLLDKILSASAPPNSIHPFTTLAMDDTYEEVETRISALWRIGIRSMDLMWSAGRGAGMMALAPFNSEAYWERIGWVSKLCRKYGMTYMIQDAAPFPTGAADGYFEKPEYRSLNKLYLSERHQDAKGPNPDGAFLIDRMVGAIRSSDLGKFGRMRPIPGDRVIAVIAMRRENGVFSLESAVDLTDRVDDGLLSWAVPEGIWRIFVVYETYNGGGRPYYMNLLDEESVALNIQAIHQPHYEHLKDEIGKTWLGFFYDETEVGNLDGYSFNARIGAFKNTEAESAALPWSRKMEERWSAAFGEDFREKLPLLWFEDGGAYRHVRCSYMDQVSKLIRDCYNGQMHRWCKERGIGYIGHNLEDENSHARLACGPVHYFRMQMHQDIAGIDLIGSQIMPEKDFTQAWYGYQEGDGRFYHYGLAKLASSAAHIAPNKNGRSFCEVFAVYGPLAGTRLRKFLYDHLFVNGINVMIPAQVEIPGAQERHCIRENNYVNRMCHLLQNTKPVIKTAVLYHAEAEWYGGNCEMFQLPAGELAKNQISYDVIPADVFEDDGFYRTDCSQGLCVNGNRYEALIIPGSDAIPAAAAKFLTKAAQTGFPVLFTDFMPSAIAETGVAFTPPCGICVPLNQLAEQLSARIERDLVLTGPAPQIRYSHFTDDGGDYYFIHNEGKEVQIECFVPCTAPGYRLDLDRLGCAALRAERRENGTLFTLELAQFEPVLLYFSDSAPETAPESVYEAKAVPGPWKVTFDDAEKTAFTMEMLENINSAKFFPRYTGKVTYETDLDFDALPDVIDLGAVYEIAEVSLNAKPAGEVQFSPYRIGLSETAVKGRNHLEITVRTNTARAKAQSGGFGLGGMSADAYNSMDPGGLIGPVRLLYKKD